MARLCRAATAPGSARYVNGANYGPEGELAATGRIDRGGNAEGGDEGNKIKNTI